MKSRMTVTFAGVVVMLVTLCSPAMLLGQSETAGRQFEEIATLLRKKYSSFERLHVVMNVKLYTDESSRTPIYNERVELKKDQKKFLSSFGGFELLLNDRYLIMVNKKAREIGVAARDPRNDPPVDDAFFKALDTVFTKMTKPKFVGKSGDIEQYELSLPSGEIRRVDVFVDRERLQISSIRYVYASKQFTVINFPVFDEAPHFEADVFNEQKFVTITKSSVKPAGEYAGYFVMVQ